MKIKSRCELLETIAMRDLEYGEVYQLAHGGSLYMKLDPREFPTSAPRLNTCFGAHLGTGRIYRVFDNRQVKRVRDATVLTEVAARETFVEHGDCDDN